MEQDIVDHEDPLCTSAGFHKVLGAAVAAVVTAVAVLILVEWRCVC